MFENCTFLFWYLWKTVRNLQTKTIISNISRLTCTINGCLKIDRPQDVHPSNMFHTPLADLPLVFQRFGNFSDLKVSMPCTHCNVSYASKKLAFRPWKKRGKISTESIYESTSSVSSLKFVGWKWKTCSNFILVYQLTRKIVHDLEH